LTQLKASCQAAEESTESTQAEFAAKYRAADAAGELINPARLLVFIVRNISNPEVMAAIVAFEPLLTNLLRRRTPKISLCVTAVVTWILRTTLGLRTASALGLSWAPFLIF